LGSGSGTAVLVMMLIGIMGASVNSE